MPDRLDDSRKAAVVATFDQLADVIDEHWPGEPPLRLPAPRDGAIVVEIELGRLSAIVLAALR